MFDFLTAGKRRHGGNVSSLVDLVRRLADKGPDGLTSEQLKCWPWKGELLCELRKGDWRISLFWYDSRRRVVLVTAFRKYRWQEKSQYDRAVSLKLGFDKHSLWRNGSDR